MISYLPKDIKRYICCNFLDPVSILNLSQVSKEFLNICRSNQAWDNHVQILCEFFGDPVEEYFKGVDDVVEYWRLYVNVFLKDPLYILENQIGGFFVEKIIIHCLSAFIIPNHNLNIKSIDIESNSVFIHCFINLFSEMQIEFLINKKANTFYINRTTSYALKKPKALLNKYKMFMFRNYKYYDIKLDDIMEYSEKFLLNFF
jgi:hypothetical protein